MVKKFLTILFVILSISASLFSQESSDDGAFDYFLLSDIPVTYGDERFRERILERTKGERDPIGLVLTGGSARALAHVGVLEYLEEEGIVPDFIVANSMGSIIGMLYAAGLDPSQISEFVNVADVSNYFNLTLPINGGVLSPANFKSLVENVMGYDLRLEDLPIPMMVICDDLVTKREIRITEGDFADVLIASFALPVYFPPQFYNGHLLVDGGVKSLSPIYAAYDYTDTVIVSTTFYDLDTINLINPITILNSSFDIGKRQRAAKDMKTYEDYIWIRCNVEQFSFMAFDEADTMARLGYEAAMAEKEELEKLHKGSFEIFDEVRPMYDERIEQAKSNLRYFERIETSQVSHVLTLGMDNHNDDDYPGYLLSSFDFGLQYKLNYKMLDFGFLVGLGVNAMNSKAFCAYPTFSVEMNLYPLSWMRLSLFGSILFDKASWIPSVYFRQGMDFKILSLLDNSFTFESDNAFEYYKGAAERYLLTSGVHADYKDDWGFAESGLYYQLTGRGFAESRSYVESRSQARYNLPLGFFGNFSYILRASIDGKEGVPLFMKDGYTSAINSNTVGFYDEVGYPTGLMNILSFTMGYQTPDFTLAELLIFNETELSGFFDILLYGLDFNFSTGVEIQSVMSLIGLLELPVRVRFAYDSISDGLVVSTIFATRF